MCKTKRSCLQLQQKKKKWKEVKCKAHKKKKQIQTQRKENEEALKIEDIEKRCAQSTNKSKGKMKMYVENVQRSHL